MSKRALAAFALTLAAGAGPALAGGPLPADDYLITLEGEALSFDESDLLANDATGGYPVVVVVELSTESGDLDRHGSTFTYTPNPGFTGEDRFTYHLDFGLGSSPAAMVRLQVTPEVLPIAGDWPSASGEPVPKGGWHEADVGWYQSVERRFVLVRVGDDMETEIADCWAPPIGEKAVGWLPLAGDWNGDGIDDVGLFDPALREYHLWVKADSGGWTSLPVFQHPVAAQGGWPLAGNWDGVGGDEVGLYLPAARRFQLVAANEHGAAVNDFVFELAGAQGAWLPIAARWAAGLGATGTVGLYGLDARVLEVRHSNTPGAADFVESFPSLPPGLLPIAARWGRADNIGFYDPVDRVFLLFSSETGGDRPIILPTPIDPLFDPCQ
jgi:Bacterial Ig domain